MKKCWRECSGKENTCGRMLYINHEIICRNAEKHCVQDIIDNNEEAQKTMEKMYDIRENKKKTPSDVIMANLYSVQALKEFKKAFTDAANPEWNETPLEHYDDMWRHIKRCMDKDIPIDAKSEELSEYLMYCIAEEASEISQRATKILRFGIHDVYEGQTARTALENEVIDLLTVLEMYNLVCNSDEKITDGPMTIDDHLNITGKAKKVTKHMIEWLKSQK